MLCGPSITPLHPLVVELATTTVGHLCSAVAALTHMIVAIHRLPPDRK